MVQRHTTDQEDLDFSFYMSLSALGKYKDFLYLIFINLTKTNEKEMKRKNVKTIYKTAI